MICKFCNADIGDSPRCPQCGHAQSDKLITKYLPQNFGSNLAFFFGLILGAVFFSFRKSVIVTLFNEQLQPLAPKKISDSTYDYTQDLLSALVVIFAIAAAVMAVLIITSVLLKILTGEGHFLETKLFPKAKCEGKHGAFISSYNYAPLSHIFLFIEITSISLSGVFIDCVNNDMNDFPLCRFFNTATHDWLPLFNWLVMMFSIAMVFTVVFCGLNLSLRYTVYEDRIVGKGNGLFPKTNKKIKSLRLWADFDVQYKDVTRATPHGRSVVLNCGGVLLRVVAKNSFEASRLAKFINEKRENDDAQPVIEKEPLFSI